MSVINLPKHALSLLLLYEPPDKVHTGSLWWCCRALYVFELDNVTLGELYKGNEPRRGK